MPGASPIRIRYDAASPPAAAAPASPSAAHLLSELKLITAPLEDKIASCVENVARLEREKGQWMELYAHSEIEFSTMVARSTTDAAHAVAADCEAYASRVQSNWAAAASRRRAATAAREAFGAWHQLSARSRTLQILLERGTARAADSRLRDALAVWMACVFIGGLREDSVRAGASPFASGSPVGDETLANRLEGIAAYAKTLADDFDAASPSSKRRQSLDADDAPSPRLEAMATDALKLKEAEARLNQGVQAAGLVEEWHDNEDEDEDDISAEEYQDVQDFMDELDELENEADTQGEAEQQQQEDEVLSRAQQAELHVGAGETLEQLYDLLAAASARADDCDTEILASDLVNETHGYTEGLRGLIEQPARPDAPTAEFLAGDLSFVETAPAAPLDFATVDSTSPLHAVCGLEERSDADSESEWSADSSVEDDLSSSAGSMNCHPDEYVPDVACVTIDLEGLMARYQDHLTGSVAFDLENGGLLSAIEYAATQQMNVAVQEHYVDGLLRRVLYSWVEFTKWSLGGHDAYMGPAATEVEGDPADVTVLDAESSSAFSESEYVPQNLLLAACALLLAAFQESTWPHTCCRSSQVRRLFGL